MFVKKKSNKGFSLIELLGAIVVVALLAVITISSVSRFLDKARRQKVVQNKQNVTMAAELYLQANRDLLPKMIGETTYIPIMDLRNSNYIKEDLTNEKGEDCMKESFVRVFKLAEGDYNYTTYLYCGGDKAPANPEPPKPYLVDYRDDNNIVKVLFSNKDDVKKANFSFKLRGSQNDDTIGLYSYSYSILARTSTNSTFTEVYNSGTIEANRNPTIEFRSRSLSSYVDLSGVTSIQIKVTALNEQGGFLSYETDALNAGGETQYEDTIPPICPLEDDEAGRQGEPRSIDSWVNKNDIGTNKYPRAITLKCEDGDGSGCKRDTFTESWPNEEKAPLGAMFGEILLEDNSVVDKTGQLKDANSTPCPVAVLVDLQAPSVDIDIINPSPAPGSPSNVAKNVSYHGETITSNTIQIRDADYAVKGNVEDTTLTIMPNNYVDSYTENVNVDMEYWLNEEFYPEGIEYHITISDNFFLYKYTWEVNKPYLNLNSNDYENVSIYNKNGEEWNRLTDEQLGLDENQLFRERRNIEPEDNVKEFVIGFKEEGARYGVLTVYDRAGNVAQIYIHANLDRTEPNIEEKVSDIVQYEMALSPTANEEAYETKDGNKVSKHPNLGFEDFNSDSYSSDDKHRLVRKTQEELDTEFLAQSEMMTPANTPSTVRLEDIYDMNSDMSGLDRCDSNRYEYTYNENYSVFNCEDALNPGYASPPEICQEKTIGEYSLYAVDTSEVERERTGCYKIGTTEGYGDNGIPAISEEDLENDAIFYNLEEYKSGTWSNQELICGPMIEMKNDNRYTDKSADGSKTIVDIDEDISGWVKVIMEVYIQDGVEAIESNFNSPILGTSVYGEGNEGDYSQHGYFSQKYKPTYSKVQVYEVTSFDDRKDWPVLREQGIHRIRWKNCDNAGNCSDYKIIENIKIDTIKPKCKTTIAYDNNLNSDAKYGPNHNGWLYDQQTVRVSNACVDSSDLSLEDYYQAADSLYVHKSLHDSVSYEDPYILNYRGLREKSYWGEQPNAPKYDVTDKASGCSPTDPDTIAIKFYEDDIMTCDAGVKGIIQENNPDTYGIVRDIAGNEAYCDTGVTIKKDTAPPACGTDVLYQYDPNEYGWANQGSIKAVKYCNDAIYANFEEGTENLVYSGCTFEDDVDAYRERENYDFNVRVASNYTGSAPTRTRSYGAINNEEYLAFEPNNGSYRVLWDRDILGDISATPGEDKITIMYSEELRDADGEPILDDDDNPIIDTNEIEVETMASGYVVDRAGNISLDACTKTVVGKDTQSPICMNTAELIGDGESYLGSTKSPLDFHVSGRGVEWAGSNGPYGRNELVLVYRDCDDMETYNYSETSYFNPYDSDEYYSRDELEEMLLVHNPYPLLVASGCESQYNRSNRYNRWIYGTATAINTYGRNTPGEMSGGGKTWDGPDKFNPYSFVKDIAGNYSTDACEPIEVNIDYTPPTCEIFVTEGGPTFALQDGKPQTYVDVGGNAFEQLITIDKYFPAEYFGTWTAFNVYATVRCMSDNNGGSGCRVNGLRQPQTYVYSISKYVDDTIIYGLQNDEHYAGIPSAQQNLPDAGRNRNITAELYAADYAANVTKCSKTFHLKQDLSYPKGECSFTGNYSIDKASDSKITITVSNLRDIVAGSDNVAVGIKYITSVDTNFANNNWKVSYMYDDDGYTSFCMPQNSGGGCIFPGIYGIFDTNGSLMQNTGYIGPDFEYYNILAVRAPDTFIGLQGHEGYRNVGYYYIDDTVTGDYDITNGDAAKFLDPGTSVYTAKLLCGQEKITVSPYLIVTDKTGNRTLTPCTGTPIEIPGCCDRTTGSEQCSDWKEQECTRKCGGGESYDYKECSNTSYYSGKSCTYRRKKNIVNNCAPQKCCSKTETTYAEYCQTSSYNPCNSGYHEIITRSQYDNNIVCDHTGEYKLCTGQMNRLGDCNPSPSGSKPNYGTCKLRFKRYTNSKDVVELEAYNANTGQADDSCKITAVTRNFSNCTVWKSKYQGTTTIRIDAYKKATEDSAFNGYNMPCDLKVYWGSKTYDFSLNPEAGSTSYAILKNYNAEYGRFQYCIYNEGSTYDGYSGSCILGGKN